MSYPALIGTGAPAVPAEHNSFLQQLFNDAFTGFAPVSRFLKARKGDFSISEGGAVTIVPGNDLYAVLLGVSPFNHCTYYEKEWIPGQEPQKPDLLWLQKDPNYYPESFPVELRQKVMRNGQLRWAYKTARRTVWALASSTGEQISIDLDSPVVFDISSMSMYGAGDPRTNSYKWAGMRAYCQSLSKGGSIVTPSMFVTQIVLDPMAPSGVVLFKPCLPNGRVLWLDNDTFRRVLDTARSPFVESLLEVKEILGPDDRTAGPALPDVPLNTDPDTSPAPAPAPAPEPVEAKPVKAEQVADNPKSETDMQSLLGRAQAAIDKAGANRGKTKSAVSDLMNALGL